MQLSSRILTALAVLILAVAVVAVRAGSPGTVEAATGTIDVLNVGTCYTTNTDAFGVGDCDDGDGNEEDTAAEGYNVAGRDSITEADSVFATYAIDPKTSGDQPRAIVKNADLVKISIEDKGRDKRTGKIYAVGDTLKNTEDLSEPQTAVIAAAVGADDVQAIYAPDDGDQTTPRVVQLTSTTAYFNRLNLNETDGEIGNSGLAQFGLTGDDSTDYPMAPDGDVYWFGTVTKDGTPGTVTEDLSRYITLDEDGAPGVEGSITPWMRISASLGVNREVDTETQDIDLNIQYIYYETSEYEEIVGGAKKSQYSEYEDDDGRDVSPVFFDDEDAELADNQDALVLRVSSDGNSPTQNLWLKEKSDDRFSGIYEGYIRLTDADGDGSVDDDLDTERNEGEPKDNWGLPTRDATGPDADDYAVIGVESGPVTITYKNSNGDTRTLSIIIDKDAPTIQVDSPIDGTASTDDSPELIGTFGDGGGSGLREDSFKIYADNTPDNQDDSTPVWDLGVLGVPVADTATDDRGQICVDAVSANGDDVPDGVCDDPKDPAAVLRSQYSGFSGGAGTFGIIYSNEIYKPTEDIDGVNVYKVAEAEDFEDGAVAGEFDDIVRIDFPPGDDDGGRYNHHIDIQAVVLDVAGNIGFSDADPSAPAFIHDLGTEYKDRTDKQGDGIKHNVIGVYSRHTYILDDVDPKYDDDQSATGFFIDADGDESTNNAGVMVVFDGPIDPATVGVGTFEIKLDGLAGGTDATVIDAAVDGKKVYLLLEEELAPDSTPSVDLADGQSIADLAGNESTDRRLDGIELNDGILPTFSLTLSGGTGLNDDVDGEGPSELTKAGMKIAISADEAIQGAPQFAVVCSGLFWDNDEDGTSPAKFASERTGAFKSTYINGEAAPNETTHNEEPAPGDEDKRTMCPDGDSSRYVDVARTNAHRRAGNNWEYDWSTLSDDKADPAFLADGTLTVIVWGRDRSSYMRDSDQVLNYSASTINFDYDTELMTAWNLDGQTSTKRELVPFDGEDVFESRPFVLLAFGDEGTTVDVTTFEVDGTDYTADLQAIEDNEFVWWPEPLAVGTYEVYVEANDAANNEEDHTYSFEVKERAPFVLDLLAGWNSISFPANPVDRALHAVFTNTAIDQVIGWNATEPVSPWRMATRVDGVWTTSEEVATLNDVEARYGYWVHSQGFITQAVKLAGKGDRATDGQPNPSDIPTDEGWNFVGVVDVDGDQTQDDAGETLRNGNNDPITAAEYLGNYTRAYTWDHINNTWDVLKNDEGIVIGSGIWVYYTSGHDIAP